MARCVYKLHLALGVAAPEDEDNVVFGFTDLANDSICELFPSTLLVATSCMSPYSQGSIEKQYSLLSPTSQIASRWYGRARVALYLSKDVAKGRGKGDTIIDREAKTVCLPWFVVGVLPYEHHLHLIKRTEIEGIEY